MFYRLGNKPETRTFLTIDTAHYMATRCAQARMKSASAPGNFPLLDGRAMILMGNPNDSELAIFPVSKNLIGWACVVRVSDSNIQTSPVIPDWNNLGHIENVLPLISNMKLDFLDIHHFIQSSMIVNEFPMTDRVILLGDSAYPMYPDGGNGASQTILNARGLILSFRQHGVTPQGLHAYDERSPGRFHTLSDVILLSETEDMMSKFKQLTDLNVQKLNQEPSLF